MTDRESSVSTDGVDRRIGETHPIRQPDDGIHCTALEEVIAIRVCVRTHELNILRRRPWVALSDLPSGRGGDI